MDLICFHGRPSTGNCRTREGVCSRSEQNSDEGTEHPHEDAIEMTLDAVGSPDSLYFRGSDILSTELGADEVIVRVAAVGINFRDLLLVLGSVPRHALGFEGAGVVTWVGTHVGRPALGRNWMEEIAHTVFDEASRVNFNDERVTKGNGTSP
ncbi:polyketide synthase [Penicillium chermesinum]|uniref:Polyketide synthase n=1 Tax=Penicillium chermesinum TaxID=63820 RepID=A0A9W9TWV0_9EURO|nr:polyketide synthase [Penicillium chermesinum]KAJ5246550.1 polyketide synthase [Penicillium chermesinum]KAJ6144818.1 polyketide synthase [Penicillium chermesinum]